MTTNLITVGPDERMERVDEIFNNNEFHHLPVVDENKKLVGILSKTDYLMLCNSFTIFNTRIAKEQNRRLFASMLVKEIMQKNTAKLHPDNEVLLAVGFFKENLFHAIPIVDAEDKLVGIVTTFDLINHAYQLPTPQ
jgi:CBS-domain-containing membrane protein